MLQIIHAALLRFVNLDKMLYMKELKQIIDAAETWEDCKTAVNKFVDASGAKQLIPAGAKIGTRYYIAAISVGLERKDRVKRRAQVRRNTLRALLG